MDFPNPFQWVADEFGRELNSLRPRGATGLPEDWYRFAIANLPGYTRNSGVEQGPYYRNTPQSGLQQRPYPFDGSQSVLTSSTQSLRHPDMSNAQPFPSDEQTAALRNAPVTGQWFGMWDAINKAADERFPWPH